MDKKEFNKSNLIIANPSDSDNLLVWLWKESKIKFFTLVISIIFFPLTILLFTIIMLPFIVTSAMIQEKMGIYGHIEE